MELYIKALSKTSCRSSSFKIYFPIMKKLILIIKTDPMIYALTAAYMFIFSVLIAIKYYNFGYGHDLGFFNQWLWLTSNARSIFVTLRGINIFGDHLDLVLLLLIPIYRLFQSALTLLILQNLFISLGALPLYYLARDVLGNRSLALALSISYFLFPALMWQSFGDFHSLTLVIPLLLFSFYFLTNKNTPAFLISGALALISREDVALTLLALGLYMLLVNRDKRLGLLVCGISAAWFALSTQAIIPLFLGRPYMFTAWYAEMGGSFWQIAFNMISNPMLWISKILTRVNIEYLLQLFGPLCFIPLLSPETLIPALPGFAENLLSSSDQPHFITYWNVSILIPFIYISLIYGIKRLLEFKRGGSKFFRPALIAGVIIAFSFASNIFFGPLLRESVNRYFSGSEHNKILHEIIDRLPEGASLSTDFHILPAASKRENIYYFPNPFYKQWYEADINSAQLMVDYILLDARSMRTLFTRPPFLAINPIKYVETLEQIINDPNYGIVQSYDGIILLKRGGDHAKGVAVLDGDNATKAYLQKLIEIKDLAFNFGGNSWAEFEQRGIALADQGRFDKAIPEFEKAVLLNPNSAPAHYNLAYAYEAIGDITKARGEYENALKIDPSFSWARSALERLK